jgi:hypothetical protein
VQDCKSCTAGWINYYGKFGKYAFMKVMVKLDNRLKKFLMNKYKIVSVWDSVDMLKDIKRESPKLFAHWSQSTLK